MANTVETVKIEPAVVKEKVKSGQELTAEEVGWLKENPNFEPKVEEKKPEELKVEKPKKKEATAAPKPAKEEATAGEETPEQRKTLIEKEIDKPEGQEDLTKFTPTEIGLYWDLKKARKKNQALAEQNEVLRVEQVVKRLQDEKEKKSDGEAATEEEAADPEKLFEGRDADDLLTIKEAKEILKKLAPKKPVKQEAPVQTGLLPRWVLQAQNAEADGKLRSKGITDFFEVIDHTITALGDDKDAKTILAETASNGGNVSERVYWLIKGSPKWAEIEKTIKADKEKAEKPAGTKAPSKENEDRARRIEEADGKIKTTGAGSGAAADTGEYSSEEVASMTIQDIQKLPRETRQAILRKFGSNPNLNV